MEAAVEDILGILERAATDYKEEVFRLGQLNDQLRHLFNSNQQSGLCFCSCFSQMLLGTVFF